MRLRPALLVGTARAALRLPDRAAHALVVRDMDAWLRIQFLGVASRTGIAAALAAGATLDDVAAATGTVDRDLLASFLAVGVSLGEVRRKGDRYRIDGRRLRAVAGDRSPDLRGLVEEAVAYDSPIYLGLGEHLRGAPKADYGSGLGDVIANASRLAEPLLAPLVRRVVRSKRPTTMLDVGCGTGVYTRHAAAAAGPGATVVGIDIDPDAVATAHAQAQAAATTATGSTATIRHADLFDLPPDLTGPFDLVLLLQNIYYWPPEQRPDVLRRLRQLAPGGTVVVASALAAGLPFNHHLDLVLRVTVGNWRLPTAEELERDLRSAGFGSVELLEPVPRAGLVAAVAH